MVPKALTLLSGGIDSPVATYLMKDTFDQTPVYFDNFPYAGPANRERAMMAARKLGFKEMIIVKHGPSLKDFAGKCEPRYTCVLCKRMMVRTASRLAQKRGCECLVMGDSLGQVASQTMQNIYVVSDAAELPVIRPLIAHDKNETIRIARKIGTYEISTIPMICCGIVPEKPSTQAVLETIHAEEAKIDIDALCKKELESAELVRL